MGMTELEVVLSFSVGFPALAAVSLLVAYWFDKRANKV